MNNNELIASYVDKYIELAKKHNVVYSKRYIATVIYNENPDQFTCVENVRKSIVNLIYGDVYKNKYADLRIKFALMQNSIIELPNATPFIIPPEANNTLWIADTHGRFCDMGALEIAIGYGIKKGANSVVILGDLLDCYNDSKFDKDPSVSKMYEEAEWGQDVLQLLQETFGYVVYKYGNHDLRHQLHINRILQTKPELMNGIATLQDLVHFDGSTVNFVEDYNHVIYGKLNGFHGHEYQGGGINVARNRMFKTFDNSISAHSHTSQQFPITDINGNLFMSTTIGCLCNLHPRYNPKNQNNWGFAHSYRDADGTFELNNKQIWNNKIF
jgi:hypothetical protein